LIIEPDDGVAPLLAAIKKASKSVEIAIFRLDRKDMEGALKAAAAEKSVKVSALIAYANRGGEKMLRKLEMRLLKVGITVARSADDLVRYHDKFMLIDRSILYVFSFNFTHLDIDRSRGFGIVSKNAKWVQEAGKLFDADCMRSPYMPGVDTFVVSPANARKVLGTFLRRARKELLIYDPMISDKEMLRILQERAKAGVEIRIIGRVPGSAKFDVQKLVGCRLHTRTIIRDRRQAFVGSQSLRAAELDSRRELGLIIHDARSVKGLIDTFESDWTKGAAVLPDRAKDVKTPTKGAEVAAKKLTEKAVESLEKDLDPLAATVKKRVRRAVAKAGEEVLNNKKIKNTVKKVIKKAVKEAVREAAQESEDKE
jgi:phosphatidylserine/phosphatidylglycerophosphate/cardiolipin synthase-like enzyme